MTLLLAVVALAAIAALVYVIHTSSKERQTLLDRIQAPEKVIEQRMVPTVENLPQAVHPDDDLDYWLKQGIDRPEINVEVPS